MFFFFKNISFSRFPQNGGTRVSSTDFFLEYFGNKNLRHCASIVIGHSVWAFPLINVDYTIYFKYSVTFTNIRCKCSMFFIGTRTLYDVYEGTCFVTPGQEIGAFFLLPGVLFCFASGTGARDKGICSLPDVFFLFCEYSQHQ